MERQQSFQDPGVSYHLWQNAKSLYQAPLSEHRLQNICTCLRDDMDRVYGHFWQVIINRTEAFGLASAHAKAERHLVNQHGVYRDGRVFSFNNIVFKCVKPSPKGAYIYVYMYIYIYIYIYILLWVSAVRIAGLFVPRTAVRFRVYDLEFQAFVCLNYVLSLFIFMLYCIQKLNSTRKQQRSRICTVEDRTSLVSTEHPKP